MTLWLSTLSVVLIILLPVSLAIIIRRRNSVPWSLFFVGVLTFLGAQIVHLPLNHLLQKAGVLPGELTSGSTLIPSALILGLTAGITEEVARSLGYVVVRKARKFEDGLMIGLGHGGIEALIVAILVAAGASSIWYLQQVDILPNGLAAEDLAGLRQQLELVGDAPLVLLAPLVERIIAIILHASLSIIVLQAFVKKNMAYIILAILIHAAFDFFALYLAIQFDNVWVIEGILFLLIVPLIFWLKRFRPVAKTFDEGAEISPYNGLNLLLPSLIKEFRYQWRTKRLVVLVAVFLVFGMVSPLLAKFTPQLLGSIEGAEQFADLIPEPTTADALGQYTKNLTQFGFILVILMGMGAIATEKEKGIAGLILSKPLPRWLFIFSKYVAQSGVYLLAIILATAAGYFYTAYLFGPVSLSSFLIINLLLLLWLMVFAAATLFGSALGRTTAMGAGIATICSALLLVAGSIPKYGAIFPGGLLSWAGQIAVGEKIAPNGGALAASVVLILLFLLGAIAAFEEQEL